MKVWAVTLAVVCALETHAAQAAPANTLRQLFAGLQSCMAPIRTPVGTDVTLQFTLNRRGAVLGKPKITHALWPKDADPKEAAAAIASGFDRCLPVEITDALGGAIAGRPILFRLMARPKEEKA